jgi:5-formyltetrahydrofolate cyclo-ligase
VSKSQLRETIREHLRGLAPTELAAASERICEAVAELPAWREAHLVAAFLPLAREPQIQPLWRGESERVFCFPRVLGEEVALLRIDDRAALAGADWKLDAPAFATCPTVAPGQLDLIFVPGVAFTRDGRRLGRGGGYYDRLLAQCGPRTVRIGVCFECQVVPDLPSEAHDQPAPLVITERGPTNVCSVGL